MKLLESHDDGDRRIRILERRADGSRLYFESGDLYTHVAASGENLLEYVEAMRCALENSPDVLLLGTAGGALATELSRTGSQVTAVDDMALAFVVARRWFHLPRQVECIQADALTFLRDTKRRWAAIAIDIFRGAEIPKHFLTTEIGFLLVEALEPGGMIVWNIAEGRNSWPVAWVARALRLIGLAPRIVSVSMDEESNTLIICRRPERPSLSII
ncbi:spermidine synthase [Phenylobacterium sp.]|uniref:spermidine synthase n=1 Tax=Phenylobacterium sp. TaxID=1871053 RepID=UPI003BA9EBDF